MILFFNLFTLVIFMKVDKDVKRNLLNYEM